MSHIRWGPCWLCLSIIIYTYIWMYWNQIQMPKLHNLMGASLASYRIRSWNQLPIKPLHTTVNAGLICHLHKTVSSRASEETQKRIFNDFCQQTHRKKKPASSYKPWTKPISYEINQCMTSFEAKFSIWKSGYTTIPWSIVNDNNMKNDREI